MNYKNVQRIRRKSRDDKTDKHRGYKAKGLMVDERINPNKVELGVGEKNHRRFGVVRSEDCAVIGYPGEVFLGHVAMEGGKGVELACSLDTFLKERGIDITELQVDSTTLHHTTLHYSALHFSTLHYTALNYTTQHFR